MTTRRELEARMQHAGAKILADHPNGLRAREVWQRVLAKDPTLENEYRSLGFEMPLENVFRLSNLKLVRAGWVRRNSSRWFLTSVGRNALASYPDVERFYQQAGERDRYWQGRRDAFGRVEHLIEAVTSGSWLAASDLAAETGLEVTALVHWLQGTWPEGWWRVLEDDGRLPAEAHSNDVERAGWLDLLGDDGVNVGQGRADPLQRVAVGDVATTVVPAATRSGRGAWLVRGSDVRGADPTGENLIKMLWLPGGVVSLSASQLRDLPEGASIEQVRAAVNGDYPSVAERERRRLSTEFHVFLSIMRPGDIVLTHDGTEVYLGVITGPPAFRATVASRANLQRQVEWLDPDKPLDFFSDLPDELAARVSNSDTDLIDLADFLAELAALAGGDEPPQPEATLMDVPETLADKLFVAHQWLQECVELLRDRAQLIFYGPPGTGKTYLARHLAVHLAGGKPENVKLVQFHPAYSYEDFFQGYRPQPGGGFDIADGPFARLVKAARDHPSDPHVLIIDEINRGNLAKIFGELYFLLEYRDKGVVDLLYGGDDGIGFTLPRNVVILGTMNTADRSIALVDTAMRRRFWFVELHPEEPPTSEMLGRWLTENKHSDEPARLLAALNACIEDREFRIGPSYLMNETATTEKGLDRIWRTQILPLLEEHHYGDGTDVRATYGLKALRNRIS
ncbi:McrB family protein [Actinomadura chokoriensis]|uniref:AAA family ATPase n=1 Tax=Actinomadura chokoriensis TaxID=454156 RepID=A0ABV4R542_9ACTN